MSETLTAGSAQPAATLPDAQLAVQLVAADELAFTDQKAVVRPGPHQYLAKVCCVGLCYSDMKLLAQFDQHVRKAPVAAGVSAEILAEIPSYVPENQPTVPGHEVVVEVVELGPGVNSVELGGRYLVQADWRDLKTSHSNGAFGYNFEGALQQYVLLDERCTVAASGESYLLSIDSSRGISANALVEPWACVEDAFIHHERTGLTEQGSLLVVADGSVVADLDGLALDDCAQRWFWSPEEDVVTPEGFERLTELPADRTVDDCLVASFDAELVERLHPLLANNGLLAIVTGGGVFLRDVDLPIGRVHYGNCRIVGYPGTSFARCLKRIPSSGELRAGNHIYIVGAGGPMGVMATIRSLSCGIAGISVSGSNRNPERLQALAQRAQPTAERMGVPLDLFDPRRQSPASGVDYYFINAPVPALVQDAVCEANPGAIINIFAGIPATVSASIDLNAYIERGSYFIGTSGSTMDDIRAVLSKVTAGQLDTNLSVAAVSGMSGAVAGLHAVKAGAVAGKIIVYPDLADYPVTALADLVVANPSIAPLLANGCWTVAAEAELLRLHHAQELQQAATD